MSIDPDKVKQLLETLVVNKSCQQCVTQDSEFTINYYSLTTFNPISSVTAISSYGKHVVTLTCPNCGYIRFFDADLLSAKKLQP